MIKLNGKQITNKIKNVEKNLFINKNIINLPFYHRCSRNLKCMNVHFEILKI